MNQIQQKLKYILLPLLLLALIGLGIFKKVNYSVAPPPDDSMTYFQKAKWVWYSIEHSKYDILNVSPVLRPPGSSIILYPLGFKDNIKSYVFRCTFIPILLWGLSLLILFLGLNKNLQDSFLSIGLIVCLLGIPIFYHFENNPLLSSPDRWGLIDPLLSAWAALGISLLILSVRHEFFILIISAWVIITTGIFIKPSGILVDFCAFFILLIEYKFHPKFSKKYFILSILCGLILPTITVLFCIQSSYLSSETISKAINAQQLHLLVDQHGIKDIFNWGIVSIGYIQFFFLLMGVVLIFLSKENKNNKRKNICILCGICTILAGSAYWMIKLSGFEPRFNYPFILISVAWIFSALNLSVVSIPIFFKRIIFLCLITATLFITIGLFINSLPLQIQKILSIDLSSGQYKEAVQIANRFIAQAKKNKKQTIILTTGGIGIGVIGTVDFVDSGCGTGKESIKWIYTLDWNRAPGLRAGDIFNCDYVAFEQPSSSNYKSKEYLTTYNEEIDAVNHMFLSLTASDGIKIVQEGSVTIFEITNKDLLKAKLKQWAHSLCWKNDFYERNPELLRE